MRMSDDTVNVVNRHQQLSLGKAQFDLGVGERKSDEGCLHHLPCPASKPVALTILSPPSAQRPANRSSPSNAWSPRSHPCESPRWPSPAAQRRPAPSGVAHIAEPRVPIC